MSLPADILYLVPMAVIAFTTLVWVLSLALRDASIMDIAWGPGFLVATGIAIAVHGQVTGRAWVVLGLAAIWAVRLAGHILIRSLGRGEDPRYAAWRRDAGPAWWWRSWFKVFLLQGVILCIVALPLLVQVTASDVGWTAWDVVGVLLWLVGFLFETVADAQLLRFRRRRTSDDAVLDRGLWRYSRHPNYFGETLLWWGFGLMALSVPGGWIALLGPALITWLILRVSGVAMLDRLETGRKPAYAAYVRRTSAFIPMPPRMEEPASTDLA